MTASNYPNVLPITLAYEGGKVNDPHDPGGRTNEGVTQRVYDLFRRHKGMVVRTVYDMEDVERDEIYSNEYWLPSGCASLPNGLDLSHFDATVNSGPGNSKKFLAKIGVVPVSDQVSRYADARLSFLHRLGTFGRYGKGWTARVAGIEAKGLKMALAVVAKASGRIGADANLPVAVDMHKAAAKHTVKAKQKKAAAGASVTAGATAAPIAHAAAGGHGTAIIVTIAALAVLAAAASGFLAWQHGQRAAAITAEAKK